VLARLGSSKNSALGTYRFCSAAQNTDKFNSFPSLLLINEILINVADLRRVCAVVLSLLSWSPAPKHTLPVLFKYYAAVL
jgi:hypothetical protein